MTKTTRSKPYWGFYGDPFVHISVQERRIVTYATAPKGIEMWITIEERSETPTAEEMKLLPPKKEWVKVNKDNEAFYVAKHRDGTITEEEKSALAAHLFVEHLILLDDLRKEQQQREDALREERNRLSKAIPKMSGKEKEEAIRRVKEIKEMLKHG